MLKKTPPMGWNSWNTFAQNINEQLVMEMADHMVAEGYLDMGYEYLVIDDCWSMRDRDEHGRLVPDPEKFPHGMKAVADYVHGKGLKFGMYSCAGNMTCAAYPGSYEHEFIDAETFAQWGVDFLKYDYCYHSKLIHGKYLYRRMGLALENCGRDILFSACSWGADETHRWIKETSASMWRSTGDIFDNWENIKNLAKIQASLHPYHSVGCFNDMDMLVVGMYGQGHVGLGGCTDTQYKTHFALWSFLGSPLMIGCDIRNIRKEAKDILFNKEMIRINQDPAARQPVKLDGVLGDEDVLCYYKQLYGGEIAIGFFNLKDQVMIPRITTDELGLPGSTGKSLIMEEVWTGEKLAPKNDVIYTFLKPYDCAVYRCKIVDTADVPAELRQTGDLVAILTKLQEEGYTVPAY